MTLFFSNIFEAIPEEERKYTHKDVLELAGLMPYQANNLTFLRS